MKNPDVLDLVIQGLEHNGYDGLLSYDRVCACLKDDLAPCGQIEGDCQAGYKVLCTPECGGDQEADSDGHDGYDPQDPTCWHIQLEKPEGRK